MDVHRRETSTIERLAFSIELSKSQDLSMSPKHCIFKTPIALYRHNERAYIPDSFSIGPLHHDHPNLKATEAIKAKYLLSLISRSHVLLKDLINFIHTLEKEAREYYDDPVDYNPEEFVKILIINGCFIIELFYKSVFVEYIEENDLIFSMQSMVEVLGHDLILLENQVPWMVLERLFSMTMAPMSHKTLIELAIAFFVDIFPFIPTPRFDHLQDIKPIIDLFKHLMVSSIEVDEESVSISGWELISSATHLIEAGIEFRMSTSNNMWDIKFMNGVLEIPQIIIHEETETLFRNLISFEQCYSSKCDGMITSYAILLDNLINTAKDVEILCEKKILRNWLNPEDAVQLFSKLYLDTGVNQYYYKNLCKQVNGYCERRWPRWRALLVRKYFNTPWAIISTLVAVILLILTFIQTLALFVKAF